MKHFRTSVINGKGKSMYCKFAISTNYKFFSENKIKSVFIFDDISNTSN